MSEQGFGRDSTFPPCSPDMNLIENLFGIITERMSNQHINTIDELRSVLAKTVQSINQSDILNLYFSWHARLAAVIKAEGGPTRF